MYLQGIALKQRFEQFFLKRRQSFLQEIIYKQERFRLKIEKIS